MVHPMSVFVLAPNEEWIVDAFVREWYDDPENQTISTRNIADASTIWLLADWCADQLPYELLATRKVLTTIHHIVADKFGPREREAFARRDAVTDAYHVYNQHTLDFIERERLTQKPVHLLHYWANKRIWRPTGTKQALREKYGLPQSTFLIGSFQRDTEGVFTGNGFVAKREKGPDLFVEFIRKLSNDRSDLGVVLTAWRRYYVIDRLLREAPNVSIFTTTPEDRAKATWEQNPRLHRLDQSWLTMAKDVLSLRTHDNMASKLVTLGQMLAPQHVVNDLYQCLDLYAVTSREEGAPQALLEAGLLNVPVVTRSVGIAEQVFERSPEAIADDVSTATPTVPFIPHDWLLPAGFAPYRRLLESL